MGVALLGLVIVFTLTSGNAAADTPVSGSITTDTTWNQTMSPIWVEGSVTVSNGATLTIDPGVEVRFDGFFYLRVSNGALIADGDAAGAGLITFTSNFTTPYTGAWSGIELFDDGASILDDVVIQYASIGVTFDDASVPLTNVQILNSYYGVWVASSSTAYSLSFSGCTISSTVYYGIYVTTQSNNDLTLQVQGCTFSSYGSAAVYFNGLSYSNFIITLDGNSFNASNRAVNFPNALWGDASEDNIFRFTFTNNWVNSSLDSTTVYLYYIRDFGETTVVLEGNHFLSQGSRSTGMALDNAYGSTSYNQSFTLRVANNEFTDLAYAGVTLSTLANYRHVNLEVIGNLFQNLDNNYLDYGLYSYYPPYHSSTSYDTTFTLLVQGNTALDLAESMVYFYYPFQTSYGFRHVDLTVSGNVFENTQGTPYLDFGVYLRPFNWYGGSPSSLDLTLSGNTARDLDDYAVYLDYFNGFETVTVEAVGNVFENVAGTWMDHGLYLPSGIDGAESLTFTFRDNQATGLTGFALYTGEFYGNSGSQATFILTANTVRDGGSGLFMGSIAYYETILRIENNDLQGIQGTGIHVEEVRLASALLNITGNTLVASQQAFNSAHLIHFDWGSTGWDYAFASIGLSGNTLQGGQYAIFFEGTDGEGATISVDIQQTTAVGNVIGVGLQNPVYDAADIMNLRIRDSTFQDTRRRFLSIGQVGLGVLPINVTGVQVLNHGDWGDYAFYMGSNIGGVVKVDVWSSTFDGALGSFGDVYAGSGPVTMNFYFTDLELEGVSNDEDQLIRTLWSVDIRVLVGRNFDSPAWFGVKVTSVDQFGRRGITGVTDQDGWVRGQLVTGSIITNDAGMPYNGLAVHTLRADWSQYNGTVAATFTSNGTATIYLPGDKDADGIPDHMDPDENPDYNEFFDPRIAAYTLQLWFLVGFAGVVLIPLGIWLIRKGVVSGGKGKQASEVPEPPEE